MHVLHPEKFSSSHFNTFQDYNKSNQPELGPSAQTVSDVSESVAALHSIAVKPAQNINRIYRSMNINRYRSMNINRISLNEFHNVKKIRSEKEGPWQLKTCHTSLHWPICIIYWRSLMFFYRECSALFPFKVFSSLKHTNF